MQQGLSAPVDPYRLPQGHRPPQGIACRTAGFTGTTFVRLVQRESYGSTAARRTSSICQADPTRRQTTSRGRSADRRSGPCFPAGWYYRSHPYRWTSGTCAQALPSPHTLPAP